MSGLPTFHSVLKTAVSPTNDVSHESAVCQPVLPPINDDQIDGISLQQTFAISLSHCPQPASGPANSLRSLTKG
jgi:hypothetical protein